MEEKKTEKSTRVVLAGNPNVGKSTLFNALTGLSQHTGNWAGKTVEIAEGVCEHLGKKYVFCDIPGTYSLFARSKEEEVARDFISFGGAELTVVVADATRLRASMNLILQVMEASEKCVLCLNFVSDAEKMGARIDPEEIEGLLGIPTACVDARKRRGFNSLINAIERAIATNDSHSQNTIYPAELESMLTHIEGRLVEVDCRVPRRFVAMRIIERDRAFCDRVGEESGETGLISSLFDEIGSSLNGTESELISKSLIARAEEFFNTLPHLCVEEYTKRDEKIDKFLTGRVSAYPLMVALLGLVLWITVFLANYPSGWLAALFDAIIGGVSSFLVRINTAPALVSLITDGVLGTLSNVVSVMLPPMAIFFPLFTMLEDSGYLPRIAYNLDRPFCRAGACGKQALTMCMGLGCNAVGVMGCRIIDSPRERLAAVLTNVFMPCNGRFPTIILLSGVFFASGAGGFFGGVISALTLTAVVILGVFLTLFLTRVLTSTLLRGKPSFFTVEMPPYRRPDFLRVITRSLLDRTLSVLLRAVTVAVPAGFIIWILANLQAGGATILSYITDFLDPFGRLLGMDGTMIAAFILGIPANEIVIPIALMAYAAEGSLAELSVGAARELLLANGWSAWTAASVIIFSLCHWPCSTTLITVKRETGSRLYAALAFIIPTAVGVILCAALNLVANIFI